MKKLNISLKALKFSMILFLFCITTSTTFAELEWKPIDDLKTYDYRGIASSDQGLYIVVGDDGIIKTSTDLKEWNVQDSGTKEYLFGCTWGNGKFVAVGFNGTIVYSEDGKKWLKVNGGEGIDFEDVTWGNGKFIAVGCKYPMKGKDDLRYILSSTDGIQWKIAFENKGDFSWNQIKYINNQYIAYGFCDTLAISENGDEWRVRNSDIFNSITDIIWDGTQYVGVGENSSILTSSNAVDWIPIQSNLNEGLFLLKITKFKNNYISIIEGDANYLITSTNLKDWSLIGDRGLGEITSWIINKEKIIASGWNETIVESNDGLNWIINSEKYSPNLLKVIWDGNKFLAIGNNGTVFISQDGLDWTTAYNVGIKNTLVDIIWTGKEYYALEVIYDNTPGSYDILKSNVYKSEDGTKWSLHGSIDERNVDKIFYFNNQFFAIGRDGQILKSPDAQKWTKATTDAEYTLNGLTWNGKQYICVGMFGKILSSIDGLNWTSQKSYTENDFNKVIWNGKMFIAVGNWKTVSTSTDGVKWFTGYENRDYSIEDVLWDGERFLLMHALGEVLSKKPINQKDTKHLPVVSEESLSSPMSFAWNGERYIMVGRSGTIATAIPLDIVKVKVKNTPIVFDVAPRVINGSTMIPARAVLEKLDAKLTWDNKTQTLHVTKENIDIILTIDKKVALVNGKEVKLNSPATIIDNKTLMPLRFLAENLGADVKWDSKTQTVSIQ